MASRGKIAWMGVGELLVICPNCGANHVFSQVDYDKFILGACAEDDFHVIGSGVEVRIEILWPQFVCRNSNCQYVATIKLPKAG